MLSPCNILKNFYYLLKARAFSRLHDHVPSQYFVLAVIFYRNWTARDQNTFLTGNIIPEFVALPKIMIFLTIEIAFVISLLLIPARSFPTPSRVCKDSRSAKHSRTASQIIIDDDESFQDPYDGKFALGNTITAVMYLICRCRLTNTLNRKMKFWKQLVSVAQRTLPPKRP